MTTEHSPLWRRLAQAFAGTQAVSQGKATVHAAAARPALASSMRPLALEQRFMFDGAGAADAAHAVADGAVVPDAAKTATDTTSALRHALTAEASAASGPRQEVVFVDSQVANIGELLAGLSGQAEVVILDASKDGLQQMADYLAGRSGLDAIHLLSHGADGTMQLGNIWLSSANLAEHSAALQSIGAALNADGDLMLYGCRVGSSEKGLAFLEDLARFTGADVAASADDTGAASLGGNWALEHSAGTIEAAALDFTASGFQGLLSTAPVIANLSGNAVNYTEKSSGVLIDQGSNAVVTDADSTNFNGGSVRVSVTGGAVTGEDVLSVFSLGTATGQISVSGSNVLYGGVTIGSVTGGTGGNALVITLNASADAAAVTALVQSLQYSNSNTTTPNTGERTVSVTVTDETGTASTPADVTVNILAVNDAPVVSVTATNPTFTEKGAAVVVFSGASISTVEAGQTVILMTIRVSNLANGSSEKLVIDGSDVVLTTGTTLTTLNNGLSVSVSVSSGTANVTVTHAGLSTATAQTMLNNITYRNDSNAPIGTARTVTLANVRDSGGTYYGGQNTTSPNVASVVTLVAVNDAPVLSGGPYVLPSTNEDTISTNVTVSSILAGVTYSDDDAGAVSGIAVTATTGRGTWQYSTDGTTWTAFGTVSTSSALLLGFSTQVRYIPDNANGENVSITFRAWDQTSGASSTNGVRSTANTSSNGGSTAYSSGTANATLIVTSVNDAPVITPVNPTMTGLTDSSTNNNGDAVSTLLGGVTDVDTGALKGIVINGLTATYGTWQFSTNNGTTWNDIGTVSDAFAMLLRPADRVRFVPDGIHGETATLTFRAWDQTSYQGYQGTKVNVTANGSATAYSSATDTASVVVTAVNDAPIVTGSGGSVGWIEGNNVTSTPVVVDSGIIVSDPDGPNIAYAKVQVTTNYASGEDVLGFSNTDMALYGDIAGFWNAGLGTLTLTSSGGAATQAQFQAALRAVTYTNTSEAPIVANRTVTFQVNDGSLDSNVVSRSVTITAVDNSPVISAPDNVTVTEDTPTPITGIVFSDVDSSSGTVTFTVATGTITGTTGVSGITMNGTGSTLTLSGTLASLNAYIAAGNLKYIPAPDSTTSVILGISLDTASVSTDTRNLTIDITAVNDAPTISAPVSINVTEDVPKSLSGITFFDVDAGTGSVTVIFSVASGDGSFTATASNGVTISNSGTNVITLEGSIADINTLITNNHLTYLGALNANGAKVMTVSINDNGNSGTGGPLSESFDVSLMIAAVNDAPVNSIPSPQTMFQDGSLTFNTANGNLISVSDVDIAGNQMKVTLSATHGLLTLGQISGLTFTTGDGTADSEMTFAGSISAINAALNGLTFTPTAGYTGTASLTILSDDQGYVGSGGAKTDVDTLLITVFPANPKITGVVAAPGSDGLHKVGDQIDIVVNFDNVVIVDQTSGSPTLLLETGAIDRQAQYISGTGTNQLTFRYTVQAGDVSADLDYASTSALSLNGAVLQSSQGFSAILTLPTVGGANSLAGQQAIVVDGIVPTISSVQLPSDGNYHLGQNLDFTVNFSEAVMVDTDGGTPRLAVTLDTGGTVYADYVSGSGGSALVFRLTVASGQLDTDGIRVADNVQLNGGSIRDVAGNDSTTGFIAPSTNGILVDGVAPTVADVIVPASGSYKAGDVLTFTVNTSETVFTNGLPRLAVDIGGTTRYATFVAGSSSGSVLVFQYTVQAGDNDADGISIGSSVDLNGGSVKDAAGNDLNLALNSVGSTAAVQVDTTAPQILSMSLDKAWLNARDTAQLTIRFSEAVKGLDVADFTVTDGALSDLVSTDGGLTWTATLTPALGKVQAQLQIALNNAGYTDLAGNAGSNASVSSIYAIDTVLPPPPALSVEHNAAGWATVRVGALEAHGRWEYSLDGGQTWLAGQGNRVQLFNLGEHVLQVRQMSGGGNLSMVAVLQLNVVLELIPPIAAWISAPISERDAAAGAGMLPPPLVVPGMPGVLDSLVRGLDAFGPMVAGGGLTPAPFIEGNDRDSKISALASILGGGLPASPLGVLPYEDVGIGTFGFSARDAWAPMPAESGLVQLTPAPVLEVDSSRQLDWQVPATLFGHSDPLAQVQLSLTLADGRPLPTWLQFDARTGQVKGTVPAGLQGDLALRLTARDGQGREVNTTIQLKLGASGPAARAGMAEQLQRAAQQRAGQLAAQRL